MLFLKNIAGSLIGSVEDYRKLNFEDLNVEKHIRY